MCGIVGFINGDNHHQKFGDQARLIFEQLLWHDTQRGADGTGVVAINGSKDGFTPTMYKNAMWAPEFLGYHTYRNVVQSKLGWARAAIGHNRAGRNVKNENAHPFVHKHITLVHNGYIPNDREYLPKDVNHEVDSFSAAYNIAEKGEKEGLEYVPFKGVLVWWNDQDKTLNMARNEHRELWCVPIKGYNAMFYSSEWELLHWVLMRNNLQPETKYKLLTPWNHFKFDPLKPKEWVRLPFVEAPTQKNSASTRGVAGPACGLEGRSATGSSTEGAVGGSREAGDIQETTPDTPVRSKRADQFTDQELALREKPFERFTAKDKRKYGIPDSRHKLRKVCAKIHAAFGGESYFGQRVVIYPDAYALYKNQRNNGVVLGSKRAHADILVEVPNASPQDYETLKKDKWAFGTVVNVKKNKTGKWSLVCALIPLSKYNEGRKEEPSVQELDIEEADPLIKGPDGARIPLSKFRAMTSHGCGNCDGDIDPNKAEDMEWFHGEPICHVCTANPQVMIELGFATKAQIH